MTDESKDVRDDLQPAEEDTQPEAADEELDEDDFPEEDEGGKTGFIVIGLLVVILIIAAVWNMKAFDKSAEDPLAPQVDQFGGPQAPGNASSPGAPAATGDAGQPGPQQRELTPQQQYDMIVANSRRMAATQLFTLNSRLCTVGRPPQATESQVMPGLLFDLEDLAEGVQPIDLLRRPLGRGIMFANMWPPLGITNGPKAVYGTAEEFRGAFKESPDRVPVIGVAVGDAAKAYPLPLVNYHEVVSDTIGETPVVVAWSAIAGAALALERTVDGKALEFGSSGLSYKGIAVIYDTATRSLWSPLTGRCLAGRMAGKSLKPIQARLAPWKAWEANHPKTMVLTGTEPEVGVDYSKDPQVPQGYHARPRLIIAVAGFKLAQTPIAPLELVLGVTVGDVARAYPARLLAESGTITDTLGGKKITLKLGEDNYVSCADAEGKPVRFQRIYWLYWQGSYPASDVYGVEAPAAPEETEKAEEPKTEAGTGGTDKEPATN